MGSAAGIPFAMAKRARTLRFRLPPYAAPRNAWRAMIHKAAMEQLGGVEYLETDRLEVLVHLYLSPADVSKHDVDNRLKDVLDALQGRAGGSKAIHTLHRIIPNDRQVYRAEVEKRSSPRQSRKDSGHVTVRCWRPTS